MSLITEVREKLKTAMREKDTVSLDTLRNIVSASMNELVAAGKSPQDEMSDEMVQKVIGRLIKQRRDSISQFEAGNRPELAEAETSQLKILGAFLPPQMPEEEIRVIAEKKKNELAITDKSRVGILTGAVMKEIGGQADGAIVKRIIESLF